jgi:hypothetical protein
MSVIIQFSCGWTSTTEVIELSRKVTLSLGLLSPHIPSFQWYPQSKDILINFSTKFSNTQAFNAQGLRLIIVVVQLGAVKIYICSSRGEALRKKERDKMKLSLPPKPMVFFLSFIPRWMLMYFFCRFVLNLTLCNDQTHDQTQGSGAVFFSLYIITLIFDFTLVTNYVRK